MDNTKTSHKEEVKDPLPTKEVIVNKNPAETMSKIVKQITLARPEDDEILEEGSDHEEMEEGHNYLITVVSEVETTVERTYFLTDSGREEILDEKEVGKTRKTKVNVKDNEKRDDESVDPCDVDGPPLIAVVGSDNKHEGIDSTGEKCLQDHEELKNVAEKENQLLARDEIKGVEDIQSVEHTNLTAALQVNVEANGSEQELPDDAGKESTSNMEENITNDEDIITAASPKEEWIYLSCGTDTNDITEQLLLLSTELLHKTETASRCTIL